MNDNRLDPFCGNKYINGHYASNNEMKFNYTEKKTKQLKNVNCD